MLHREGHRALPGWAVAIVVLIPVPLGSVHAGDSPPLLAQIPPGTLADPPSQEGWNSVILLARPTLASGDVDAIPSTIAATVNKFVLTLMANIERTDQGGTPVYRLVDVGAGYSVAHEGKLVVVTSESAHELGIQLGFIERQLLKENERQLSATRVVARSSTLLLFDVPAVVFFEHEHRDFVMRHLVWIDRRTGVHSMLVWLLEPMDDKRVRLADRPARWVLPGTREERRIHVDASTFLLGGIPTERSFALEDLPPGRDIEWFPDARKYAGLERFSADQLRALIEGLNASLHRLRNAQAERTDVLQK